MSHTLIQSHTPRPTPNRTRLFYSSTFPYFPIFLPPWEQRSTSSLLLRKVARMSPPNDPQSWSSFHALEAFHTQDPLYLQARRKAEFAAAMETQALTEAIADKNEGLYQQGKANPNWAPKEGAWTPPGESIFSQPSYEGTYRRTTPAQPRRTSSSDITLAPYRLPFPANPAWNDSERRAVEQLSYAVQAKRNVSGGSDPVLEALKHPDVHQLLRDRKLPLDVLGRITTILEQARRMGTTPGSLQNQLSATTSSTGAGLGASPTVPYPTYGEQMQRQQAIQSRMDALYKDTARQLGVSEALLRQRLPELSDEQLSYVESPSSTRLASGGPGTGKGTTLTWTFARAVAKGQVRPQEVFFTAATNASTDALRQHFNDMQYGKGGGKGTPLLPNWNFDLAREQQFRTQHAYALSQLYSQPKDANGQPMQSAMERLGKGGFTIAGGSPRNLNDIDALLAQGKNQRNTLIGKMFEPEHEGGPRLPYAQGYYPQKYSEYISQTKTAVSFEDRRERYTNGKRLFEQGQANHPDAVYYRYETVMSGAKQIDLDDPINLFVKAAAHGLVRQVKMGVFDEIQDNSYSQLRMAQSMVRPGGTSLYAGDMGQGVMANSGRTDRLLSQFHPELATVELHNNYRSPAWVVAQTNVFNMAELMQQAGTAPLQVAMGKNRLMGQAPSFTVRQSLPELHEQVAQKWFGQIGVTHQQMKFNVEHGYHPLGGATLPPVEVPIIVQMKEEREKILEAIRREVVSAVGAEKADRVMEAINPTGRGSYRTPGTENLLSILTVPQSKGHQAAVPFVSTAHVGAWDDLGHLRNLMVATSRATDSVHYFHATNPQFSRSTANWKNEADFDPELGNLPRGFAGYMAPVTQNMLYGQEVPLSDLPGAYQAYDSAPYVPSVSVSEVTPEMVPGLQRVSSLASSLNSSYREPVDGSGALRPAEDAGMPIDYDEDTKRAITPWSYRSGSLEAAAGHFGADQGTMEPEYQAGLVRQLLTGGPQALNLLPGGRIPGNLSELDAFTKPLIGRPNDVVQNGRLLSSGDAYHLRTDMPAGVPQQTREDDSNYQPLANFSDSERSSMWGHGEFSRLRDRAIGTAGTDPILMKMLGRFMNTDPQAASIARMVGHPGKKYADPLGGLSGTLSLNPTPFLSQLAGRLGATGSGLPADEALLRSTMTQMFDSPHPAIQSYLHRGNYRDERDAGAHAPLSSSLYTLLSGVAQQNRQKLPGELAKRPSALEHFLGGYLGLPREHEDYRQGIVLAAKGEQDPRTLALLKRIFVNKGGQVLPFSSSSVLKATGSFAHTRGSIARNAAAMGPHLRYSMAQSALAPFSTELAAMADRQFVDPQAVQYLRNGEVASLGRGATLDQLARRYRDLGDEGGGKNISSLRRHLTDPQWQEQAGHTLAAIMRTTTGAGAFKRGDGKDNEVFDQFFAPQREGLRGGTRTIEGTMEFIDAVNEATRHMQEMGGLKRGQVDRVLSAMGHDPADRQMFQLLPRLARQWGSTESNLPLAATLQTFNKGSQNEQLKQDVAAQLTRVPLQQGRTYRFMGGAEGYPDIVQGNGQGLETGMEGTLLPWDPQKPGEFGYSRNVANFRDARMLATRWEGAQLLPGPDGVPTWTGGKPGTSELHRSQGLDANSAYGVLARLQVGKHSFPVRADQLALPEEWGRALAPLIAPGALSMSSPSAYSWMDTHRTSTSMLRSQATPPDIRMQADMGGFIEPLQPKQQEVIEPLQPNPRHFVESVPEEPPDIQDALLSIHSRLTSGSSGESDPPPSLAQHMRDITQVMLHGNRHPQTGNYEFSPLSDQQRAFVTSPAQGTLLNAGPGSGKTGTMVRKGGYLASQHGILPSQQMYVSYMRSGVDELTKRLFGDKRKGVRGIQDFFPKGDQYRFKDPKTIHSLGWNILMKGANWREGSFPVLQEMGIPFSGKLLIDPNEGDMYGLPPEARAAMMAGGQSQFLKGVMSQASGGKSPDDDDVKKMLSFVGKMKSGGAYDAQKDPENGREILTRYEQARQAGGHIDPTDLLTLPDQYIQQKGITGLPRWMKGMRSLFFDEAQDNTKAGHSLIRSIFRALSADHPTHLVLGQDVMQQQISPELGGLPDAAMEPLYNEMASPVGGVETHDLTVNHRSDAGPTFLTKAFNQWLRNEGGKTSRDQSVPPGTALGNFPRFGLGRTQPQIYRKMFGDMQRTTGLSTRQMIENFRGDISPLTGSKVAPSQMAGVFSRWQDVDLFQLEAARTLSAKHGIDDAEANAVVQSMFIQSRSRPREGKIADLSDEEQAAIANRIQLGTPGGVRSHEYEQVFQDVSHVGGGGIRGWLKNMGIGGSRLVRGGQNSFYAANHPFPNREAYDIYKSDPDALLDPGQGDIQLPGYDARGILPFSKKNRFESFNGGFVPAGFAQPLTEHLTSLQQAGYSPTDSQNAPYFAAAKGVPISAQNIQINASPTSTIQLNIPTLRTGAGSSIQPPGGGGPPPVITSGTGSSGGGGNDTWLPILAQNQGNPPPASSGGGGGGGYGGYSRTFQVGRAVSSIGSELQNVGQTLKEHADQKILQGSEYRHATMQLTTQGISPTSLSQQDRQKLQQLGLSSPTVDPLHSVAGAYGDQGAFDFSDPGSMISQEAANLPMYSYTQIARTLQNYLSSSNQRYTPSALGGTNDILALGAVSGVSPDSLIPQFSNITGYAQAGSGNADYQYQNRLTAKLAGMVTSAFHGNLTPYNVTPYMQAMNQVAPTLMGMNPQASPTMQIGQAGTMFQLALNSGMSAENLPAVADVTNQMAGMGFSPNLRQQYALAQLYGEKNLTASPDYWQYQQEQLSLGQQVKTLGVQQNIFGDTPGGLNALLGSSSALRDIGVNLQSIAPDGKLSLPQLQINADNAQITLDKVNFQAAQFGLAQGQASFNFEQYYQTQQLGPIGATAAQTGRSAYFDFERRQLAAGYNPLNADQASTFKPTGPVFGLQNEQFYAGVEHQRSMLVLGRSPLLADAAFQEQMKYLNKQENFYVRSLDLQNQQRQFQKDWGQRSLDMQAAQLKAQQAVVADNILFKQYDKQIHDIEAQNLPRMVAIMQALLANRGQWIGGQGPINGGNVQPLDIVQRLATAYSGDTFANKTGNKDNDLYNALRSQGLSSQEIATILPIIKQAAKSGVSSVENQVLGASDGSLLQQTLQMINGGAFLSQQQQAYSADQALLGGGTEQTWQQMINAVTNEGQAVEAMNKTFSPGSPYFKLLGDVSNAFGQVGKLLGSFINIVGLVGGAGGAGGMGGGTGGAGGHVGPPPGGAGIGGGEFDPLPISDKAAGFWVKLLEDIQMKKQGQEFHFGPETFDHYGIQSPHVNADFHQKMNYGIHQGVDFAAPQGSPLSEFIGGEVTGTGFYPWGGEVDVRIPGGMTERYIHLSSINVHGGQKIKRGDRIGLTGGGTKQSGLGFWSSGAHSHVQYDYGNINKGEDPWVVWLALGDHNLSTFYGSDLLAGVNSGLYGGNSGKSGGRGGTTGLFHMYEGGIAMRPITSTLADGGEPEAVIPLSKLQQVASTMNGSSGSATGSSALSASSSQGTPSVSVSLSGVNFHVHTQSATMSDQEKDQLMADAITILGVAVQQVVGKH